MDKGDYELFVVDGPTSWGRPKLKWKYVLNSELRKNICLYNQTSEIFKDTKVVKKDLQSSFLVKL